MANKEKGEIDIVLDNNSYTLRPTFNAVVEFEDKAGVSVFEALRSLSEKQSMPIKHVTAAYHACIKATWKPSMGRALTFEEVGQAIRKDGLTNHIQNYALLLSNMLTGEKAFAEAREAAASGNG